MKSSVVASDTVLRTADLLALSAAMPVAYRLHQLHLPARELPPVETLWPALIVGLGLWFVCAWLGQVYEERPRTGLSALGRSARALGAVALVVGFALALTEPFHAARILFLVYFAVAFPLLAANRLLFRLLAHAARRRGYHARRFAVVGTGGMAREIVEAHLAHPEWGMRFAGFVAMDGTPPGTRGPLLGRLSQLGRLLEDEVLDAVYFAVPREQLDAIDKAVVLCQEQGVEVQISLDVLRFGPSRMRIGELDGLPMLSFTRTPTDSIALAVKRAFDVLVSAAVLLVLAIPLGLIALAVKLDSPGPVVFRQRRVGLNGRAFQMVKFRSMYVDAEARLEALKAQNEMSGPVFKMANDPRVTKVGRFLRRTSLDEFPQFWNVLRGEMSIVGPRPPIPAEVRQYKRWQRRRLSMKPGITCIWQISGRNNIDFDHWMELDLEYIDHWSIWTDLEICVKTIPAVLSARGAR